MKRNTFSLIAAAALALSPAVSQAARHTINMVGTTFSPATLSVTAGDTVVWKNLAAIIHTSTSGTSCTPDGIWNSGNIAPGDSFMLVPANTGTFPYYCIFHCSLGMTGTLTVSASGVGGAPSDAALAHGLLLGHNRPNPFHHSTRIDYQTGRAGDVSIRIYNTAGQLVRRLGDEHQSAGGHAMVWDGLDGHGVEAASGIYFYQVAVDGIAAGKQMLKMK
jgi:plastocyanin